MYHRSGETVESGHNRGIFDSKRSDSSVPHPCSLVLDLPTTLYMEVVYISRAKLQEIQVSSRISALLLPFQFSAGNWLRTSLHHDPDPVALRRSHHLKCGNWFSGNDPGGGYSSLTHIGAEPLGMAEDKIVFEKTCLTAFSEV